MTERTPKAFISYSWSSPEHRDLIRSYAERLVCDGIDVVLDQWELSEGQDKYVFMERMVADPSVSHVIVFSDSTYTQKADKREAGVGTESQIISKEVYDKVDQRKFIPVVCELKPDGKPFLPIFLEARIWIDFSTSESANENWERLLRALYGKPVHEKPTLGKPPPYLVGEEGRPALPTIGKYNSLRTALLALNPSAILCRNDFLDAAIKYADDLRVREQPKDIDVFDEQVLKDLHSLLPLRNQLTDWLLLEASLQNDEALESILLDFLERFLALKYRPPEITSWNSGWFDAHGIFVYEMFLYLVAALVKADKSQHIHEVLTTHFMLPDSEAHRNEDFVSFSEFYTYSEVLDRRNKRLKHRRMDPVADLMKERATRTDLPFRNIMQAELIVFLMSILGGDHSIWYPHTLVYASPGNVRFPLFIRAAQHKGFQRLKTITGIATGDELRAMFKAGCDKHEVNKWRSRFPVDVSSWNSMNMDALDTQK